MGRGQALYKRARKLIPGGTQLLSKRPEMFLPEHWPAYYERAEGAYVWDLDGHRYVDMSLNGIGACPLGYADPDVNRAAKEAIVKGSMTTLNCPEEVILAELLCEIHPWAEMVRLARTGGESMAIAVRIARAKTGRAKVAFCGYHGWCDWYLAANLTGEDVLGSKDLLLSGLDPNGLPPGLKGTAFGFRHNHLDELQEIVSANRDELAAIVVEPQRSEKPDPGFLEGVRTLADETGAVLVFDEITSAMRLCVGGVHLLHGVAPDIAVFAKGIGNGHPIGAVIGTGEVMEAAQTTFISSTYWTERVGPAAAIATIRKHRELRAWERLTEAGIRVQEIWKSAAGTTGLKGSVGHPDMPPLSHIHFEGPDARAVQTLLCQLMLDRGFLDNGGFYATYAHTPQILDEYALAVNEVFPILAEAQKAGDAQTRLRGPVGHSGFARLTS